MLQRLFTNGAFTTNECPLSPSASAIDFHLASLSAGSRVIRDTRTIVVGRGLPGRLVGRMNGIGEGGGGPGSIGVVVLGGVVVVQKSALGPVRPTS
jgi:hypothetical protein